MPALPAHLVVDLNFLGPAAAKATCRLYYKPTISEPNNDTDMNALADIFFAAFDNLLAAVLADTCFFLNVRVRFLDNTSDLEGFSTDNSEAGAADGTFHGEEIAVVIQRRSNSPGRNKRGRIFLPFVPQTFVNESSLSGPAVTAYKAVATAMEAERTYDGTTYVPCTPNFKDGFLEEVKQCRLVGEIMSRRDRRFPKRPAVYS